MRALLIVDMQPIFCEGGELPVPGGHDIADRIADFLRAHADRYGLIVTTQDWHINPGSHFSDTPDFVDTWPPHGQAGTPNAELHPRLQSALEALRTSYPDLPLEAVRKGQYAASYSGFDGTTGSAPTGPTATNPSTSNCATTAPATAGGTTEQGRALADLLRRYGTTEVDVVGLALSHCVCATALDAQREGFATTVFADLSAPVSAETEEAAQQALAEAGVAVTHSPYWTFACYTASRFGTQPGLREAARRLGEGIAQAGHGIVYGGGNCGLMGVIADAALSQGGSVYGVIPHHFDGHEVSHDTLTRLEVVEDMSTRKNRMAQLADCFVALPGGVGTLEEFFEVWAHRQLGIHQKPVVLYNTDGYWDSLLTALASYAQVDILSPTLLDSLIVVDTPEALFDAVVRG